jgi:hypothetical protein
MSSTIRMAMWMYQKNNQPNKKTNKKTQPTKQNTKGCSYLSVKSVQNVAGDRLTVLTLIYLDLCPQLGDALKTYAVLSTLKSHAT